jgi:hypothetical protein
MQCGARSRLLAFNRPTSAVDRVTFPLVHCELQPSVSANRKRCIPSSPNEHSYWLRDDNIHYSKALALLVLTTWGN